MLIFFFFLRQQSKFSRSSPFFFVYQFGNQEEKIKNTLFYVYIAARSRIQQEHGYDFVFNNSRGCKNPNFFLIYVAEINQEMKDTN